MDPTSNRPVNQPIEQQTAKKPSLLTRTKSLANLSNKTEVQKAEVQREVITKPQEEAVKTRPTLGTFGRRISTLSFKSEIKQEAAEVKPNTQIKQETETKQQNPQVTAPKINKFAHLNLGIKVPVDQPKISEHSLMQAQAEAHAKSMMKLPTSGMVDFGALGGPVVEARKNKEELKEAIKDTSGNIAKLDDNLNGFIRKEESFDAREYAPKDFKSSGLSTLKDISSDIVAVKKQKEELGAFKEIKKQYSEMRETINKYANSEANLDKATKNFENATKSFNLAKDEGKVDQGHKDNYQKALENLNSAKKLYNETPDNYAEIKEEYKNDISHRNNFINNLSTSLDRKQAELEKLYSYKEQLNKM